MSQQEQEQFQYDLNSLPGMESSDEMSTDEDPTYSTVRKVLGAFLIITALTLMIFIFPWGNSIDGNILAAQLAVFGLGLIVFFISIATFVAG